MIKKSGQISVNTENIFPIIRKWLYSDHDIFLRELVSNASDAIRKYTRLVQFGEAGKDGGEPDGRIDIVYDREARTLSVSDNGIGMTAEEVEKYINQIAFSGAVDFIEKYKEKSDGSGIIGHFGLGFYAVFIVSEHVTIDTLSWQEGAEPVLWASDDGQSFELSAGKRETRGTTITLHLDSEAEQVFDGPKFREILHKYCQFMPYPIYFTDIAADKEAAESAERSYQSRVESYEKRRKEALDKGEAFDEEEPQRYDAPAKSAVNNTQPLWLKNPRECSDEEYKSFYHEAFGDFRDPLFWIHLNMDYPFQVKGILYFPQYENKYETLEGRIKLYNNQVFVADNIKEVIPDFLFLLKGTLDCPDLPLNVSRSFLQNDAYVRKLSEHIVRKVADRLTSLFKKEREQYESYWKDIEVFVKYGCLRDEKFYDRVMDCLLFRTTEGKFRTLQELGEKIHYVSEPDKQAVYVRRAIAEGNEVVVLDHELDPHYISFLENKHAPLKFMRVDSLSQSEASKEGEEKQGQEADALLSDADLDLFKKLYDRVLGEAEKNRPEIELRTLGKEAPPAMLAESEESRRMQEMRKSFERMQGGVAGMDFDAMFPLQRTLVLNASHPLLNDIKTLEQQDGKKERAEWIARTVYKLALLAHGSLQADALADFIHENVELLDELARG